MPLIVVTIVLWALLGFAMWREPRRLANTWLLGAAGLSTILLVTTLVVGTAVSVTRGEARLVVLVATGLLVPVGILALIVALIANGVVMMRKEGRSLGNALSLLAGVALAGLLGGLVTSRLSDHPLVTIALLGPSLLAAYVGCLGLTFLVYGALLLRTSRSRGTGIVVLGSGLVRGRVPRLLAGRLDRAIAVYERARRESRDAVLVPTGGQGPDEPVAEGRAMADYLLARGIPEDDILVEDQARTTQENIELSRVLLAQAGHDGPVTVVTSGFHTLRAALITRDEGLTAQVVGSRTAPYFLPSALLRELAALIVRDRWLHGAIAVCCMSIPTVILLANLADLGTR